MTAIIIAILAFIAFFIEACLGFGGGLITIPLFSLFIDPVQAVHLILVFQFLKGLGLISLCYQDVDKSLILNTAPGVIIGVFLGFFYMTNIPADFARLSLAFIVFIYILQRRFLNSFLSVHIQKIPAIGPSSLGGFIHGAFGMGGSVLVMFFKEKTKDHIRFRANIIAIFLCANFVRLGTALPSGIYADSTIFYTFCALPFVLLGLYLGQKYHHKISQRAFENILDALLVCSAISLLIKATT